MTQLWKGLPGLEGIEHKDCNGKYDLLFKAMDDETYKSYTNDFCYEDIGNGEKVKWTMETTITNNFTLEHSVKCDTDNIAIINGKTQKTK